MNAARLTFAAAAFILLPSLAAGDAWAEAGDSHEASPSVEKVIEDYCVAVSDAAAEQRTARQAKALNDLKAKVEERITRLEQSKSELETLIKRQEALRTLADQELVSIYSGMAPETAAAQMEKVGAFLASSVLRQLKPRQASAILNEMKPEFAAQLVKIIASAPQRTKAQN